MTREIDGRRPDRAGPAVRGTGAPCPSALRHDDRQAPGNLNSNYLTGKSRLTSVGKSEGLYLVGWKTERGEHAFDGVGLALQVQAI